MRKFTIDYRYLKAFEQTARHLNFSKAAEELNIAQSAISRQIKLLEESVGEQLIIRSSKKVVLTEKGKSLLKEIEKFELVIQDLFFEDVNKFIHIGILQGLLDHWFNDILADFSKRYQYQIKIDVTTLDKLKENLENGTFDLIFTTENIQSEISTSLKLFEEKMILISKESISLNEGHLLPWIVYSDQDHLFHMYKTRSQKIIIVNSLSSILRLVERGLGIAVVPDHVIHHNMIKNQKLHVLSLHGLPQQFIYLSTLNFRTIPPHIKSLIDLVTANTHKLPY